MAANAKKAAARKRKRLDVGRWTLDVGRWTLDVGRVNNHITFKKDYIMATPEKQILVCQSFRLKGDPKGICHKQTDGFLQYIEEEILDRGLDMQVVATGCLKQCESGPVMVVQPENWWFKGVDSEEAIDTILDSIEDGEPAAEYLIS